MTILSSIALIIVAAPVLASDQPVNEWCPVLTDQKADPTITTVYQGKTVAFCCDRCRAKFLADPEKYAGRLPQFGGSPTTTAPSTQEASESEGHDGQRPELVNSTLTKVPRTLATDECPGWAGCIRSSCISRWRASRWRFSAF
jgi:YHS domain-containing protein